MVSNKVKAGSGLIKGCVVQSGTCFVGEGRAINAVCRGGAAVMCTSGGYCIAGWRSSCPCSDNERTRCNSVVAEKLQVPQLVKKFPTFYGTRRFVIAHSSVAFILVLGQINPVHAPTSHFLNIHFNIILPSTPGSPQWSFPQVSQPKSCTRLSRPHTRYMLRPSHCS
jgi:hypothetical protein